MVLFSIFWVTFFYNLPWPLRICYLGWGVFCVVVNTLTLHVKGGDQNLASGDNKLVYFLGWAQAPKNRVIGLCQEGQPAWNVSHIKLGVSSDFTNSWGKKKVAECTCIYLILFI